jgi:hypothetical protein
MVTSAQRSAAAAKAAQTRRANKAAGIAPKTSTSRKRGGPAFSTPKPTTRGLKLVVLAQLEDLVAVHFRDIGINQEARDAFAKYQKVKTMALAGSNGGGALALAQQTEADSALRMAVLTLVKLVF